MELRFGVDINKLPKKELLMLLSEYDVYIQGANDEDLYKSGWRPVSIEEFYNNEYQEACDLAYCEGGNHMECHW